MLNESQRDLINKFSKPIHLWESNVNLDANKLAITIQAIQNATSKVQSALAEIEDCLHTTQLDPDQFEALKGQREKLKSIIDPLKKSVDAMANRSDGIHTPYAKLGTFSL